MRYLISILILIFVFFISCSEAEKEQELQVKKVAAAGNEVLTEPDFRENLIATNSKEDSVAFANKSIEKWALEALLYQEALTKLEPDEMDVEKQVQNYKKQLINYIYETKLIENNLDTVVDMEEIEAYYNEHLENFILKDNIIKVNYFKIPVQSKEINKIKKLIQSVVPKDREQLEALCLQHAESFFINDSIWLLMDEIKREIPQMRDQLDYGSYKGRIIEFNDSEAYYYLKIKDVKIKNSASPLAFEKENIKTYIINSRKVKLIENYKRQLLENAKKNNTFKIF
ncbi:MAG: hypothetical protein JNM96_06160 [Bacteroidia bacterium]|nr:hypothetical protein [Bacteroidia bacterium]